MDSFCPKCKHPQKINIRQLKKHRRISCTQCKYKFNPHASLRSEDLIISESMTQDFGITGVLGKQAHSRLRNCFSSATVGSKDKSDSGIIEFSLLSEQNQTKGEALAIETYPWQKPPVSHSKRWITGSLVAIFLFIYQVIYFTGYPLSQNQQLRPWINILSNKLNYPLPTYRNLAEFTTIGSTINKVSAHIYRLQISFINHADFAQRLPDILVSLHNFHGGQFAQRAFSPQEYLGKDHPSIIIASSATADIDFFISVPEQDIGGYSIELK